MKKCFNVLGVVMILCGTIVKLCKIDFFEQVYENHTLISGAIIWSGFLILLLFNIENIMNYYDKNRMTDKEFNMYKIEKEDERRQFIELKSKSIAFDLMNILVFLTYLTLLLLGELSFFSFILIGMMLLFCNFYYFYKRNNINKKC